MHSCKYPELVPKKVKSDPLINGEKSIRIFCQNEIRPNGNELYSCSIEEITTTDEYNKNDPRRIILFVKNVVRIVCSCRKKIIIQNDRRRKRRDIDNNFFSTWSSKKEKQPMKFYDFVKPIFSEFVPDEAIADTLIANMRKCGHTITYREALQRVKKYKNSLKK